MDVFVARQPIFDTQKELFAYEFLFRDGLSNAFPDIDRLAADCRFSDCSHRHEPGCRVRQAVAAGDILPDRLESYFKMQRELTYFSRREQTSADRLEKERWKSVAMTVKALYKRGTKR